MPEPHYRTCTLCEAMCGIRVETEGQRVVEIRGDDQDPFSRGHICPKALGLKDLHEDPDRLRTPLKRVGERFEPISWDEALDTVARQLLRVQKAHGRNAVAVYQGNPTVHNLGSMIFSPFFVASLRTRACFSATSVDQLPHMLAAYAMFGHQLAIPLPDVDRTDFMLILGANPAVSNGSLMTAPGIEARLRGIRARGGSVVLVDPRRTETAKLASEHHFIRPGTDALFLMAMLHTLLRERLTTLAHLRDVSTGFEELERLAAPFSPEAVSAHVGISEEVISGLALKLARTERAVVYGRMGTSTQDFGGLCAWLINVLNAVTGHLDSVGGAMFTRPAIDPFTAGVYGRGHFNRHQSRVRNLPEFSGELPVSALAEEIETPGQGQIRALISSCGNPVLSTPNGARLEQVLPQLDFMVSVDMYLNETSRHANIILPPASPLEREHYDLAFHVLAVRNTAKYSDPVWPRPADARHDWEIWNELWWRMELRPVQRVLAKARALTLATLGPRGIVDLLLRTGPHGLRAGRKGLSVARLRASRHGIDLGPLVPILKLRLRQGRQKLALAPSIFVQDVPRLLGVLRAPVDAKGLVLIGRRQLRSNNSWLHNSERLIKGPARCTLQMHPADAAKRGLRAGGDVEITSRVGHLRVPLEITESLMEGVVSLPHGFGHLRQTKGARVALRIATAHAGESINDLTDDHRVDALTGNASFSGLPVQVRAIP